MPQRVNFYNIFRVNDDGSIEPTRTVQIGAVRALPGVKFGRDVSFGGVNFSSFIGRDLEVENETGVTVITGIFSS